MASDRDSEGEDEFFDSDDLSEIHQGIVNDDLDLLRQALESGVDINEKFSAYINPQHEGMTPLALASALNKVEAVKLLLTYRARVNDTFASLKTTALMTSSFHGHSDVVRILLKKGADVKAVDLQGSTALGYAFGGARTIDVICQLLQAGVDVNQKNMLGMNALLLVAGYGNDVLAKMILDAGADSNATNDFGHSALHLTVVGKRSQIKKLTSGQAGPYGLNRRDIDVALKEWARLHRDTLRGRDNEKELEKVGEFMKNIGSKLYERDNINDEDDNDAMKRRVEAVWGHRQEKLQAVKDKKKPGVLDNFLSCGGKRSKQAKHGNSSPTTKPFVPMDYNGGRSTISPEVEREINQISDSCSRILRMIIDAGCEIDKMEKTFGMTALDMAILLGDVESTAVLIGAGGDASHLMKMFALTDLYEAIIQADKKQIKELLTYDTDVDVNQPFSQFNITGHRGTSENSMIRSDGLTPLTVAAQMSQVEVLEIIKILLKNKADIDKVGPGGSSPIAEACCIGNLKMVQFLVSQGANVETKHPAYKDATPVVVAAMNKHPSIVDFLITKGAKVDKLMTDGRTSLIKAAENNDKQMIELLLNADLLDNYSDRHGFMYQMADRYQHSGKELESLMRTINEEARCLSDKEQEEVMNHNNIPYMQPQGALMSASVGRPNDRRQTNIDESFGQMAQNRGNRGPEVKVMQEHQMQNQRQQQQLQQRPKQPQRPPPPVESSEEEEEEEEDEDEEESDEEEKQHVPQTRQQQQPKQQKQQPKQQQVVQQQQKPKQQQQLPSRPPPQAESSEEEEEEEEEEESVVKQMHVKQQPKQQQPTKQQQQQLKQKLPTRPPEPQEESTDEDEEDEEEAEEEKKDNVQQKHKQLPVLIQPLQLSTKQQQQQKQQLEQQKQQQLVKQPQQKQQLDQQPKKTLPEKQQQADDDSEDEEDEEEEDDEEEEQEQPKLIAQTQKQVMPLQPMPQPQGIFPEKQSKPATSSLVKLNAPKQIASSEEEEDDEEEEEEEEEEEDEEEDEEEEQQPVSKKPLASTNATSFILPSAKFENRSFQVAVKEPEPKTVSKSLNLPVIAKTSASASPVRVKVPVSSPASVPPPLPASGPPKVAFGSPLGSPPPPLPTNGPPSETPSEEEDDEDEWDEDGDFEEHHISAVAKDDISAVLPKQTGTTRSTVTSTNVHKGATVTKTVVTKTVVTSGVRKTNEMQQQKGKASVALVEELDDDEEDEEEEDDEDEEDDDEEDEDEDDEDGQHKYHSTETDI